VSEAEQREAPGQHIPPPWDGGVDITVSQLEELRLRASREDYRRVIAALQENGSITVIPDP